MRAERQKDLKEKAKEHAQLRQQEAQCDYFLKQRERQRLYRLRDTRTHIEREEGLLKRKEEKIRALRAEQEEREQNEFQRHATFQPTLFTRQPHASGQSANGAGPARSASTGTIGGGGDKAKGRGGSDGPLSPQSILEKQLLMVRKLAELDADVRIQHTLMLSRRAELQLKIRQGGELDGGGASNREVEQRVEAELRPELQAAEMALYRRRINLIHCMERLDVQVLSLQKTDVDILIGMGYRMRLAEAVRQDMNAPQGVSTADSVGSVPLNSVFGGTEVTITTHVPDARNIDRRHAIDSPLQKMAAAAGITANGPPYSAGDQAAGTPGALPVSAAWSAPGSTVDSPSGSAAPSQYHSHSHSVRPLQASAPCAGQGRFETPSRMGSSVSAAGPPCSPRDMVGHSPRDGLVDGSPRPWRQAVPLPMPVAADSPRPGSAAAGSPRCFGGRDAWAAPAGLAIGSPALSLDRGLAGSRGGSPPPLSPRQSPLLHAAGPPAIVASVVPAQGFGHQCPPASPRTR